MRECWPDGTLRAFLDRELPVDSQTRLEAHLEACPQCRRRCQELAARAERVLGLVGALPVPAALPVSVTPRPPVVRMRPRVGLWAAAVALAAGWAAWALLSPRPVQAPHEAQIQAPAVEAPPIVPAVDVPAPPMPVAVRPPVRTAPRGPGVRRRPFRPGRPWPDLWRSMTIPSMPGWSCGSPWPPASRPT